MDGNHSQRCRSQSTLGETPGRRLCQESVVVNGVQGADADLIEALPLLEIVASHSSGLDKMICEADRYVRSGEWKKNGDFKLTTKERIPVDEVFEQLKCTKEGLTSEEGENRLKIFGPNKLEEKNESKFLKFLGFMWNPLSRVMEAATLMAIVLANGDATNESILKELVKAVAKRRITAPESIAIRSDNKSHTFHQNSIEYLPLTYCSSFKQLGNQKHRKFCFICIFHFISI